MKFFLSEKSTPALLIFIVLAFLAFNPGEKPAVPALPVVKLHPDNEPMRAAQILVLDMSSWDELDTRFAAYRDAGISTVIIRVFHNPGDRTHGLVHSKKDRGVYFQTDACPVIEDILLKLCEAAHNHGLRIHAWMTTRNADYGKIDPKMKCQAYDFATRKYVDAPGISPLLPETRDYLARLFTDLSRYPIDGVMLQDDLMLHHNEDFNPLAAELYFKDTGRRADPALFYRQVSRQEDGRYVVGEYTDDFNAWTRWKAERILDLIEHLRRAVEKGRPGIKFGINTYYETVTNPPNGLNWFSQDLARASKRDIDYFAVMLYHRQMQDELHLTYVEVSDLIDKSVKNAVSLYEPARLMFKLQTMDWQTRERVDSKELDGLFRVLSKYPGIGLAVVPCNKQVDLGVVARYYKSEK